MIRSCTSVLIIRRSGDAPPASLRSTVAPNCSRSAASWRGFPVRPRPDQVDRTVHRDPVQPGAEVRARFEASQLLVCPQEGLLDDVFGVMRTAGHPVRKPVDGAAMAIHERMESFAVSVAGQRDGCGVRLRHPSCLDGGWGRWLVPELPGSVLLPDGSGRLSRVLSGSRGSPARAASDLVEDSASVRSRVKRSMQASCESCAVREIPQNGHTVNMGPSRLSQECTDRLQKAP